MSDVAARLKELEAERQKIITEAKAEAEAAVAMLNSLGIGVFFLGAGAPEKKARKKTDLPPKYVSPDGKSFWSGKGRTVAWMKELLEAGHSKDEYLNPQRRE